MKNNQEVDHYLATNQWTEIIPAVYADDDPDF